MTGNLNDNYTIIEAPEMNEIDLLGKLLEKYTPGTTYNEQTKTWTVPYDVRECLLQKKHDSQLTQQIPKK